MILKITTLKYDHKSQSVAIRISNENGLEKAQKIANKYGYKKVSQIGNLKGYYSLENLRRSQRVKRHIDNIAFEKDIEWMEYQQPKIRVKRDIYGNHFQNKLFNDPLFFEQWYLNDELSLPKIDINVLPVWKKGITGKNSVVTILDDGIEHNHTDLYLNYDQRASWDINDDDSDPFPRLDDNDENKHGTRCAGEVASIANNNICGVGVAFNSKVGGVRMLDGHVTDKVEAASLSLNPQYIDIYSSSWGPNDDGKTVEGPGTLALAAFINGINHGRGGLGSIYVWASGNGGHHDDDCNCDGYANSIYTLSISSASDQGQVPWYSETCAAVLASTPSSGSISQRRIITTDLHNTCTKNHTGTSASAPIAAGVYALLLEANKNLTWRDVQHLTVYTSNWKALASSGDWNLNKVGLHFHQRFGFGLLDTNELILWATNTRWKTVPESFSCKVNSKFEPKFLGSNKEVMVYLYSDGCEEKGFEILYLEYMQVVVSLDHSRRGDLSIDVISPSGTKSPLLDPRSEDDSIMGFDQWKMTTSHFWGENPRGIWTIKIKDNGGLYRNNMGIVKSISIILHGTRHLSYYQIKHRAGIHGASISSVDKKYERSTIQAPVSRSYQNYLTYLDYLNYMRIQKYFSERLQEIELNRLSVTNPVQYLYNNLPLFV